MLRLFRTTRWIRGCTHTRGTAWHTSTPTRDGVLDQGASYYAPKSFLAPGNRRILWGWLRETRPEAEFAAAGWSGVMSLPRVLTVNNDGELEMNPAIEIEALRGPQQSSTLQPGAPLEQTLITLRRELFVPLTDAKLKMAIRLLTEGSAVWELLVDASAQLFTCGTTRFALPLSSKPEDALRIFIDASVIECLIASREALTSRVYNVVPGKTQLQIELLSGTSLELKQWPLAAISPDRLTT